MPDVTAIHTTGPIDPERRLDGVDMVRGFALFGVMLVNMYNFGASSPLDWMAPIDELAFSVKRIFFETKSWRLFSFLFGFGFALQMLRAEERGARFLPFYLRRLVVLLVIGMGHKLLYGGDILMYYAWLGLILVFFRKVPLKVLLVVSAILIMAFPVERAVTSLSEGPQEIASYEVRLERSRERLEERRQSHVYSVGSIGEIMEEHAPSILLTPFTDLQGPESALPTFAMFLLGLYAGRRRIFHDIEKHRKLIQRVFVWGLSVGLLSMIGERILNWSVGYSVFSNIQEATVQQQFLGDVLFAFGSTALCLGYAAAIIIAAQHNGWKRILSPLGAVGRLALTTYLVQSLMFTTLFYGYGFGQAFRIGPAAVSAYAVLFFTIQILACTWWVRHFRFGPMEWLWRTLTYLRVQPIRIRRGE
jgi:uncharacterized protein